MLVKSSMITERYISISYSDFITYREKIQNITLAFFTFLCLMITNTAIIIPYSILNAKKVVGFSVWLEDPDIAEAFS